MPLTVVVASTDASLATVAHVKEELGITTTSADDRIARLILQASAWADRVVGYPLAAQQYREAVAGYGTQRLMLSRTPLVSVSALFYGTDTGSAIEVLTTEFSLDRDAGFLVRPEGWDWTVPVAQDLELRPVPGQELTPWLTDYVAGFSLVGHDPSSVLWSTVHGTTSTGRTLPYDIEDAVITKVTQVYRGLDNVAMKQVGDLRIEYGTVGRSGEPVDPALSLLKAWRRSA